MTFNIHHGEGLDGRVNIQRIADLIQNAKADVIALQEVDRYRWRSGYVDQAKELAELLGMDMRFAPSLAYTGGQYGNAILSRYPIEDSSYTLLPGNKETRSLLEVKIKVGSEPVRIADTHLGLSKEDRSVQLARISEKVANYDDPLVVAGDFNMELDSFPFKLEPTQLTNVPLRDDVKSTFVDGKRIDHIFTNRKNVQSSWAIPTIFSDHFPVITLIRLGSSVRV
ncbi:endonuclease/exonuclease/phosphatase family protein [Paenibacillus frigoriresistens]|uniref:endonuclease/exonuclease/phosphatase family protein n=1 Tax=Paenibacillus alginolyticus TaxID=59839 RepID=UPI001566EA6F|nr:endonuclease/exonuclease/phosphatase family protein [Paenibacillus frigoriresistens]NRF91097.1 endonuclease/exonuclease/phosphatase family protein [Paenibacillus frigoriresistens]